MRVLDNHSVTIAGKEGEIVYVIKNKKGDLVMLIKSEKELTDKAINTELESFYNNNYVPLF